MSIDHDMSSIETEIPRKGIFRRIAGAFAIRQGIENPKTRAEKLKIGEIRSSRLVFTDPNAPFTTIDTYHFGGGTSVRREELTPTFDGESIIVKSVAPTTNPNMDNKAATYTIVNSRSAHLDASDPHDLGAQYWTVRTSSDGRVSKVEQTSALVAFPSVDQEKNKAAMGPNRTVYRVFRGEAPETDAPASSPADKDQIELAKTLKDVLDTVEFAKLTVE